MLRNYGEKETGELVMKPLKRNICFMNSVWWELPISMCNGMRIRFGSIRFFVFVLFEFRAYCIDFVEKYSLIFAQKYKFSDASNRVHNSSCNNYNNNNDDDEKIALVPSIESAYETKSKNTFNWKRNQQKCMVDAIWEYVRCLWVRFSYQRTAKEKAKNYTIYFYCDSIQWLLTFVSFQSDFFSLVIFFGVLFNVMFCVCCCCCLACCECECIVQLCRWAFKNPVPRC